MEQHNYPTTTEITPVRIHLFIMPHFLLNFKVNIIYSINITWLQTFSTKLDAHLTVLFSCLGFVHIISSFLADQSGSLPDPGEAELLARAVLLTADLQQTKSEEPGLELLLQPLLDVLRRLSTNVYLVLHKTDKSLQLLLHLLQLHRRRSDTEKENGVCCVWENKTNMPKPWIWCVWVFVEDVVAVALKTHMLSTVESAQEFLLRRLSGELREVRVFYA